MSIGNDIVIRFVDGGKKVIRGVEKYYINAGVRSIILCKNGYDIIVPLERVLYLGRVYDLDETIPQKMSDAVYRPNAMMKRGEDNA